MELDSRIARILHEEHGRILDLMGRLEVFVDGPWLRRAPDIGDEYLTILLRELDRELASATAHHFEFEERKIFPALNATGDVTIPYFLRQEHDLLRNLSEYMLPKVENIRRHGFTMDNWAEFRDLSLELVAKHISHIQREEAVMLPLLNGLFAARREGEVISLYAQA